MFKSTVSLIGMPGTGKSSVGVLLAKQLGLNFLDTDLVIQVRNRATLQEIIQVYGYLQLRELEEQVLLDIPLESTLVSTGGSVVYSAATMSRLQKAGPVVFIKTPLEVLRARVNNEDSRGIARAPGQNLADVFNERMPLYHQYASLTVNGASQSVEATADLIAARLIAARLIAARLIAARLRQL